MFIKVEVDPEDEEGNKRGHEPVRINVNYITDYRPWLNNKRESKTVFFFDKRLKKPKIIANISVEEVDEMLNTKKNYEESVA